MSGHIARVLDPFRFVLIAVAGWMNQHQLQAIEYLREENLVPREHLGERRLRLNDAQRRRLAAKPRGLGRKMLAEVATIVTPEGSVAPSLPLENRYRSERFTCRRIDARRYKR